MKQKPKQQDWRTNKELEDVITVLIRQARCSPNPEPLIERAKNLCDEYHRRTGNYYRFPIYDG